MQKFEHNLTANTSGALRPLSGAFVTVTDNANGLPAALYSDNGVTRILEPLVTDNTGYFGFYAADGKYTLTFSGPRFATFTREILLEDPADNPALTAQEMALANGASKVGYGNRAVSDKLGEVASLGDYTSIGDAIAANGGRAILVPEADSDAALPADYSGVLLEYTGLHPMRLTHMASISGTAKRTFKGQFPAAHADSAYSILHIESQAKGSGKNGPTSADTGLTIAVHKQGYAGGTDPVGGEIDGLSIFVRQDGPKGQASGSATSSDASGILVNIQNVEDVGFTSAWEATTSNYKRSDGTTPYSIQTQIGVLDMNKVGTPTYGFVAVASRGANGHGLYVANGSNGGTWTNVLFAPNMVRIDNVGNYYALTPEWTGGAWTITRPTGANSATQILHRGTGALFLYAQEGAIQFGTGGAIRWEVSSGGTLRPSSTNTNGDLGDPNRRITPYAKKIDMSAAGASGLVILSGAGSPEGAVAGSVGSLYLRSDGGAGTTFYVKESGTGNTGWVAK